MVSSLAELYIIIRVISGIAETDQLPAMIQEQVLCLLAVTEHMSKHTRHSANGQLPGGNGPNIAMALLHLLAFRPLTLFILLLIIRCRGTGTEWFILFLL